jgi:hypothetical protein
MNTRAQHKKPYSQQILPIRKTKIRLRSSANRFDTFLTIFEAKGKEREKEEF